MSVKQISVFLENKPGCLHEMTKVLADAKIDLRGLSLAETSEFGIVRLIVDDVNRALELVKEENYTAKLTDVISVVVPDKPNGLNELLRILTENSIEIDYLYVFIGKNNLGAQAILKAPNIDEVESLLLNNYY